VTLSQITHVPMGQARIQEQGGLLYATNMRTIADGVRSMFQPVVAWEAELDWADNTNAIRVNAINSRLSGEDVVTRLALDRVNANQWKLSGDFVSPSYRINVYDGDRLVGTLQRTRRAPTSPACSTARPARRPCSRWSTARPGAAWRCSSARRAACAATRGRTSRISTFTPWPCPRALPRSAPEHRGALLRRAHEATGR
jgi:hypothetical protein